ncbi:glycosyltransferase family 8 protein [Pantoea agglomerans]|uniref:glycosyltransferase family 8 protein n=1 Tax=Enterobacter agglomerans TaxID=549 RepID=UPI00187859BE|nr:glycosyltransferase [Pantoea agglomerans]MBE5681136.1 sugar glycosyltransferase [Pantoea agglomerans]
MAITPLAEAVQQSQLLVNTLADTDDNPVHVAFGINYAYARGMGITLFSLLSHHPDTAFHAHVFSDSLCEEDVEKLRSLAKGHRLAITLHIFNRAWVDQLPAVGRYPKSIHYRFLIPETVASYSDRVIYIDADTLVVGDYSPLFTLDITDYTLAACNDTPRARHNQCARLRLKHHHYFNSGFMLINIPRWLERQTTARITDVLVTRGAEFGFPDQDALNIVLEDEVLILPDRYNYIYDIIANKVWDHSGVPEETVMIHYTGKCKPWHAWAGSDLSQRYYSYYQRSPWASQPLDTPKHYKEMKRFARVKWHQKQYAESLSWMMKYVSLKFFKQSEQ